LALPAAKTAAGRSVRVPLVSWQEDALSIVVSFVDAPCQSLERVRVRC